MGEIVVVDDGRPPQGSSSHHHQQQQQQSVFQQYQQQPPPPPPPPPATTTTGGRTQQPKRYEYIDGQWVQLTAAGVPRKKPGRKPGTTVKPKAPADGSEPKQRKPRKPRDSSVASIQRKRKIAPASDAETEGNTSAFGTPGSTTGHQSHVGVSPSPHSQHLLPHQPSSDQRYSPKVAKREGVGSMQSILNAEPEPNNGRPSSAAAPTRTSGQSYDPIRGNYDPVRETMSSHSHSYPTSGSPRGLSQLAYRSPSIASLIEPHAPPLVSPSHSHHGHPPGSTQSRLQAPESTSTPASPSVRPTSTPLPVARPSANESKKDMPALAPPVQRPVVNPSNFTTISNGPIRKFSPKQNATTGVSTPKTDNLDDMAQDSEGRSILDFGKARPGEEMQAPTIVLSIPLQVGETNKYVNFMRTAEEKYGWDALHPRLAANRDRKARIAAAAASLEKVESGRESGDEMSVDLSDGEGSNPENGGTSGPDAQAKPKKKRNFKEDQYDVDDDFVDDSELLWEAQAAASRDGFFVYSGPLVPEVEKPPPGRDGPRKRGRGGGRGSRGGRGGSTRGTGTGRGGGPGSRGGSVTRKPRMTKSEKLQREKEKAERENLAKSSANGYSLQPTTPSFTVTELGA